MAAAARLAASKATLDTYYLLLTTYLFAGEATLDEDTYLLADLSY